MIAYTWTRRSGETVRLTGRTVRDAARKIDTRLPVDGDTIRPETGAADMTAGVHRWNRWNYSDEPLEPRFASRADVRYPSKGNYI